MANLTHAASITINATPEEVYALISDPTRTGESSPVCHTIVWAEGATGVVGDEFVGHNKVGDRGWETSNVVTVADGSSFGWTTGPNISTWTYSVVAGDEAGTSVLTESWEFPEAGQDLLRTKFGDRTDAIIAGAPANTAAGVEATLAAMKKLLEAR